MTTDMIREILFDSRTDITFEWHGHEFLMYYDEGHVTAYTDRCHIFGTWEEMLDAPVFWGKKLSEVAGEVICNY